ncbi:hypothetical protein SLAV_05730 [Streptomyces lavendulae subsp. lavendulae]|uniref:Uncharacterized protein n=2 Tax=Streptomyces lavendulae TaxID=1914 RepID=A0A2K8P8I0_STRLA|nr:hypothetical protein SLAV_05730 [Streptomyces lavendulae subsp. lavendulae]QUQ52890.1 hypothetical protein SLLC_03755 [Streptomyces lavendulae subsp. lavendulae]
MPIFELEFPMKFVEKIQFLAYDPGVTPREGGLPGLDVLKNVISSINLFGIIAVVGALAISALVWAWGHHSGGHQAEANGKKGTVVAAGCALLLGAANGIVAFFSAMGTQVH